MALDNFRTQHIIWDKANRKVYEDVRASSGDENGRKLSVQVINDGVVESLAGFSLSLAWETKNKSHSGLDSFVPIDISKGIFELAYKTGMLKNIGELTAQLVLIGSNPSKITSDNFIITVFDSVGVDAAESSNDFSALITALATVNKYDSRISNAEKKLVSIGGQLSGLVGLSTATPLFSENVAGMTDTSRPYINKEDGFVYYYDVAEGIFKSSGVLYQAKISSDFLATNILKNANFQDATGWYGNAGGLTVVDNVAKLTMTRPSSNFGIYQNVTPSVSVGHKYYIAISIKPKRDTFLKLGFLDAVIAIPNLKVNEFNRGSAVIECLSSKDAQFYHTANTGYVVGDVIEFEKPIVIDLSKTFGLGNEPSASEMDAILSKFPNGWFEGSISPLVSNAELYERTKKQSSVRLGDTFLSYTDGVLATIVEGDKETTLTVTGGDLVKVNEIIEGRNIETSFSYTNGILQTINTKEVFQ